MDKLDSLFDLINKRNGFFIAGAYNLLMNGIFGSKPNTKLMVAWKNAIIKIITQKTKMDEWITLGTRILEKIRKANPEYYKEYTIFKGYDTMYPIEWKTCVTEYIRKPYDNYQTIIRKYQPLICLVNSVYRSYEKLDNKKILEGKMPINYFINKSYQNLPIKKK